MKEINMKRVNVRHGLKIIKLRNHEILMTIMKSTYYYFITILLFMLMNIVEKIYLKK
jgi:hypothetical protein